MPKQPAFPGLSHAMKKKQTRREKFLAEMDAVVPWVRLLTLIAPHYPKVGPKGGRRRAANSGAINAKSRRARMIHVQLPRNRRSRSGKSDVPSIGYILKMITF